MLSGYRRWLGLTIGAASLVGLTGGAACAGATTAPGPTPATAPGPTAASALSAAMPPAASPAISPLPGSSSSGDQKVAVDAALRDAAAQLGVSSASLQVSQVEARQWGDSSLGCPRPEVMYSQVVTSGFLIVVSGGGKQLEYHSDDRGRVVLCQAN